MSTRTKAFLVVSLLIIVVMLISLGIENYGGAGGLSGSDTYTISVTGSTEFTGSYMVIKDGKATTRSVQGRTPRDYTVTGSMVSCAFQKTGTGGGLIVKIIRDGKVVNRSSTSAAYGMVSVTN